MFGSNNFGPKQFCVLTNLEFKEIWRNAGLINCLKMELSFKMFAKGFLMK